MDLKALEGKLKGSPEKKGPSRRQRAVADLAKLLNVAEDKHDAFEGALEAYLDSTEDDD